MNHRFNQFSYPSFNFYLSFSSKPSEYGREFTLQISEISSYWNDWHRFLVMAWLKPWSFFFTFNWLLSFDEFQWVFLVHWELIKCLIIAVLRGIGGLEGLVMERVGRDSMLVGDFFLLFNGGNVSAEHFFHWVEGVMTFRNLREVLLLDLSFVILAIFL